MVRSLALRGGDTIQFRYEEDIVSDCFKTRYRAGNLVGDTAYLTYLDNRDPHEPCAFVPNRQATIASVKLRGTSYIITLTVRGFVDHREIDNLADFVQSRAIDQLPSWAGDDKSLSGYWAAETSPIEHQYVVPYTHTGKHLRAFESCVQQCMKRTDFCDGKYMFASILDTRSTSDTTDHNVTLKAGKTYRTSIYVYKKDHGPQSKKYNYRLRSSSECAEVEFLSPGDIAIEAEYDELHVTYKIDPSIDIKSVSIVYSIVDILDDNKEYPCFSADLHFLVEPIAFQSWFRLLVATAGIAAPQLIRLSELTTSWKIAVGLIGAFAAAAAILYKKK